MKKKHHQLVILAVAFAVTGCSRTQPAWRAAHVTTLSGFDVPECALFRPESGTVFVSNIESKPDEYWTDDARGYISVVGRDNRVKTHHWIKSTPTSVLHAPKGMCMLGEHLYFTDNTRLMRCSLAGGSAEIVVAGFQKANDLVADGGKVWLSDTAAGKVFCVSPNGDKREIPAPAGVNGITFFGDAMFGVSWDLHEVYELDPSGKNAPAAFGLAEHFTNLDGIEVLDDGTFVVSDFKGDAVYAISPDRASVRPLIELPTPADIGLNREDGLLYVPQFMKDKLAVYRLEKTR